MKTATTTNKPVVTIGSEVCYRTKAGSYNRAIVKDIVDSEYGKLAVLGYTDKDGKAVEFKKLLKSVFVYTGKKSKKEAKADEAEAPAAESELSAGDSVFYATKNGKVGSATVVSVEGETATIKYTYFNSGKKPVTKKLQRNIAELYRTREECEAAMPATETEVA